MNIRVLVQAYTKGCYVNWDKDEVIAPTDQPMFETIGEFETEVPEQDPTGRAVHDILKAECSKRGWLLQYRTGHVCCADGNYDYCAIVFKNRQDSDYYWNHYSNIIEG